MSFYDYEISDPRFDVQLEAATSTRRHYKIAFPSPIPIDRHENNTVYGDLFTPQSTGKTPLVILTHGFGDASLAPCMILARLLVRQDIATFVWYLPIHSQRLPQTVEGESQPMTPQEWLGVYQRSVVEIRRFIDWAYTQEEFDHKRITVAGISMGGIISSIAMAVDARIWAGIFIAIGGNMAELSWGNETISIAGGHGCSQEDCMAAYSKYPEYLNKIAEKGLENVIPAKECFLFDPLTFAKYLHNRSLLMINAENDEFIPRSSTISLWEAYGKPPLIWIPDTHVGTYTRSNLISTEIAKLVGSIT
jgi:hypothetical protein